MRVYLAHEYYKSNFWQEWNGSIRKSGPAKRVSIVKDSGSKKKAKLMDVSDSVAKPVRAPSPPKFKMPINKVPAPIVVPIVSKTVQPATPRTVRKPTMAPEASASKTRTSTRRASSIRHAVDSGATFGHAAPPPPPAFKMPEPIGSELSGQSHIMQNALSSSQATPLGKRARQPRSSTIKTSPSPAPVVNHAELALAELAAHCKPLCPTVQDLDRPLRDYMRSLIAKRLESFEEEIASHFASFETQLTVV